MKLLPLKSIRLRLLLIGSISTIGSLFVFTVTAAGAAMVAQGLRCEYLANPLGIDSPQPRLSWALQSAARAQTQAAYQVLVTESPATLASDKGDLWDSGRVPTDQTIQVPYGGQRLRSGQRVYWKVRVWDNQGQESAWSEPAFWQMGLLSDSDWKGQWITHPAAVPSTIAARNGYHSALATNDTDAKWVIVDLGRTQPIDSVRLFPARPANWRPDTPGFLFPGRFRVDIAETEDFQAARTVVDRTDRDVPNPGTNTMVCDFQSVQGRFVRLTVTKLNRRDGQNHAFALAEFQTGTGDRTSSAGAKVSALDSIEEAGWSKAWLVDGQLTSAGAVQTEAQPVTFLRRDFAIQEPVLRATAYVTALGLYQLRLNGQAVGDRLLAPEWTDYHTRVHYQVYDVTPWLRPGENTLAALLGEGWYAGRIGMSDGLIGKLRGVYGSKPWLLAQVEVELAGGHRVWITSDASWTATKNGPIRRSDLLDGESYDARREMPGWDAPGFEARDWESVDVRSVKPATEPQLGNSEDRKADVAPWLVAQPNEPIRVITEVKPVALTEPKAGVFVFDLGQNMAGRCRVALRGPAGSTVTIRHAEMTNEDGTIYTLNLRGAPQVDHYTFGERDGLRKDASPPSVPSRQDTPAVTATYEPTFTQHGFRYVEITGLSERPTLNSLVGRVFNSAAPEVGQFECSDPQLNQLWRNILWTQRANLMSAPTDCPQRDERLGWMGDIQAFSQTAIFHMDLAAFFTKFAQDIRDAQADDGRFADFSPHPYGRNVRFTGAPAWGDAGTIVPWRAYVNYGDTRLLADHYTAARRWVDFIRRENPDLIWRKNRGNDYNDWLNGDWVKQAGWPTTGGSVPKEVFATAFFAHSTELVAKMAQVLARDAEAQTYSDLADEIKAAFNRAFVTAAGGIQGDTQAGYALALHFNLLPEPLRAKAADELVEGIHRYGDHLSTGIQSTHRAMLELTRWGHTTLAWQLLTNRTFPSWGYMIENGATTIWERWDGYVQGRGFQDAGMNSFNHWALGSVGEWMSRHILGFNPDEDRPGWKHFTIRPRPGGGVTWARGRYDSIRGPITSDWKLEPGRMLLNVSIPANTSATVWIPAADVGRVTESGQPARQTAGATFLRMQEGAAVFEVRSGTYHFRN